jgi:hypothetical protein
MADMSGMGMGMEEVEMDMEDDGEMDMEMEMQLQEASARWPEVACPYCYEDYDLGSLCVHLDEDHPYEPHPAVRRNTSLLCNDLDLHLSILRCDAAKTFPHLVLSFNG